VEELLDTAVDAARRAGELLLERAAGPARGVSTKSSPTDLVSDADRDSESLVIELITANRPDDGILSEEGGGEKSRSGLRWVIDPLDGTVNFLYGIPAWAVSIAVEDGDGALAGAVFDPNQQDMWTALRDRGAWLNGEQIRVSSESDLSRALVGTGFSYNADARAAQSQVVPRLLPRVRDIRRSGSAALDLAALACGRLDGFYEALMEPWDRAAGELIIREAGGIVSPLEAPVGSSHGLVAAGPALHDQLRALVVG